jgi:regulatory protein
MRKVSDYSIKKALKQIEDKEYVQTLEKLIHKKWKETKEKNDYKKKYKVLQYVVSRGFESDIANELIKMTNEEQ